MFLVDSGDAAVWADLTKHLANIFSRSGAEIIGITRWDERKLAFTIKKRKRGTYVLAFFVLQKGDAVAEIERDCRLSEKVLRCIILRADHFTVANMRMQLGEDIHEDVAQRLFIERGEEALAAAAAAAIVAKPAHTGETVVAAEAAPTPPPERAVQEPPDDFAEETETP
jgi:ribosomal protein S6